MAEEFQESEVIFHHGGGGGEDSDEPSKSHRFGSRNHKAAAAAAEKKRLKQINNKNSAVAAAPMSIPENVSRNSWLRYIDQSDFSGDDDGEMVPPHIIVGRRMAGKMMAFSVCTGNGRTLKGRDLSRVRNSVLRMTGFLET